MWMSLCEALAERRLAMKLPSAELVALHANNSLAAQQESVSALSNSDIIAICAALIAALAFFATVWQAMLARRHSRLSVLPLLEHTHYIASGHETKVIVQNAGLGPAVVHAIYFTYADAPEALRLDQVMSTVASMVQTKGVEISVVTIKTPSSLLAGKDIELFHLRHFGGNEAALQKIIDALAHYRLCIEYRCMYGTKHTYAELLYAT